MILLNNSYGVNCLDYFSQLNGEAQLSLAKITAIDLVLSRVVRKRVFGVSDLIKRKLAWSPAEASCYLSLDD